MTALLAWINRADESSITADSEIATLPASNLQNPHLAKKWHSGTGVKSASLTGDFGAVVPISTLALLGTNLTATANIRLRLAEEEADIESAPDYDSDADGWTGNAPKTGFGGVYKVFTAVNARYWLLDISDAALADNIRAGRLFLGPHWEIDAAGSRAGRHWGGSVGLVDHNTRAKSKGGQMWVNRQPQARVQRQTLDFLSAGEAYEKAFDMLRTVGLHTDVLFVPDISGSYVSEEAVWGLLLDVQSIVNRAFNIYSLRLEIEERL